ncbi:tyrosine-protein phosphatase [Isobaculum melis]|uniref:Protein-tyrosine phosphatase n=1 Tax=Isobaculum melis TaxID=142588 RepID=A0A1H9TBC6_9LACT|nr:tyrosine-protein phosphatase [Isobaculum melis]SER94416.1 protein-tyrosine phosphatase [Isobaculum melis]
MTKTRLLPIENGINFRDLGGYQTIDGRTVKWHKLIRSASLNELSLKDQAFLKDYGLKTIVDFRSPEEAEKEPDMTIEGTNYLFMPVFDIDETKNSISPTELFNELLKDPDGVKQMVQVNKNLVLEPHATETYRQFFQLLLENIGDDHCLLFHCTAGKDRTGFGAALILSALGVPQDTIMEDYLLSAQYSKEKSQKTLTYLKEKGAPQAVLDGVADLLDVKPVYLQTAFDTINEKYGNMSTYLIEEMGIDETIQQALKDIYLD